MLRLGLVNVIRRVVMGGNYSYFFTNALVVIVGLVALITVIFWPRQKGKRVFVAFVAVAFVAVPLVQLLVMFCFWWSMNWSSGNGSEFSYVLFSVLEFVSPLLVFTSSVLLLIYAVQRCRVARAGDLGEIDLAESPGRSLLVGPRWETEATNDERVSIARRREWPFCLTFRQFLFGRW